MRTIVLLVSAPIVLEYQRVLAYPKFDLTAEEIRALIENELLPYAEVVEVKKSDRYVPEDPSDDKFIDCALAGKADYLVTGDRHLLALGQVEDVPILTVTSFLSAFRSL